jgi:hypothetical protein
MEFFDMNVTVLLVASLLGGPVTLELKSSEDNPLYQEMRTKGVMLGGQKRELPAPVLGNGVDKEEESRILLKIVGGSPAILRDFLQDTKVAPTVVKMHDVKTKEGTLCLRDVWFVIYSELGEVDASSTGPFGTKGNKTMSDEGGIKIVSQKVDDQELESRGIPLHTGKRVAEVYVRQNGELFGDVAVAATNRVLATGDNDSSLIALRTDSRFNNDPKLANYWHPTRARKGQAAGESIPYEGGCSYTKITKLKSRPGALLVETHFAFWEPSGWFEGATPLRSKLQAAADAQARRLRTDILRRKREAKAKGTP